MQLLPELLSELHVEALVVPDPDGLVLAAGHNQRFPTHQKINQSTSHAAWEESRDLM